MTTSSGDPSAEFTGELGDFGRDDLETVGGKAANLGELVRAGLPVPAGYVITTDAYRAYLGHNDLARRIAEIAGDPGNAGAIRDLFRGELPPVLRDAIVAAYQQLGAEVGRVDPVVAVRSSATAEDLAEASFAGQQDSYLNVCGASDLLVAVERCWASLWTDRAMAYRARQGIEADSLSLAVVVQELVDADAAGVMFTANPINGRRSETMIGAAWGLGEAVVSGAVNTDQVVVAKSDGRVVSRQTAEKRVQTIRVGSGGSSGGTAEQEVPADRRGMAVLSDDEAAQLAKLGRRIEDHFGAPQDIEWARADGGFAIVQSRPITALPLPVAETPSDWPPPADDAIYVRASIVEQLPDPLSPLFADLIEWSVERSLRALFAGFGVNLAPGSVTLPTINGYAYYAYRKAAARRMFALVPLALPILSGSGDNSGRTRWREGAHPRYAAEVDRLSARPLAELADTELLGTLSDLLDAGTEYYTSVQAVIPGAASAEVFFSKYYETVVRRREDPPAATFLLGYDSIPILAEKALYDLAEWVRSQPVLADWVRATSSAEVVATVLTRKPRRVAWREFAARLRAHLDAFGHMVYNLDFVNPIAADDPAPLIDTLRFYLDGGGESPYERQRRLAERRDSATQLTVDRLDPARRRVFERLLRKAQELVPDRENALADVGLAWPQLRRMLAELGRRLVRAGAIDRADQVCWLTSAEIGAALAGAGGSQVEAIERRQELWRGQRLATPPQWLPKGTWMDWFGSMMPASSADQSGDELKGIGASAGIVTAVARVLGGPEDFGAFQPGEVLVASITTPAWTSLFARASAVVTDIGGPLSHSSIVAREYGIPAVLGTNVATRRIVSGQEITVDGDAGTVRLTQAAAVEPRSEPPHLGRRIAIAVGATTAAAAGIVGIARYRHRKVE